MKNSLSLSVLIVENDLVIFVIAIKMMAADRIRKEVGQKRDCCSNTDIWC